MEIVSKVVVSKVVVSKVVVSKVVEFAVEPIGRQVGYLIHYKSNCQKLQSEVEKLSDARERLQYMVEVAERKGDKIMADVQNWMREVDEITQEANKLLKDDHQAKIECVNASCHSPMLHYKLSKKAIKLVQVVDELFEKRDFDSISYRVRPQELYNMFSDDYEAFDSRNSTVKEIMDELRNPTTNAIGVYGIGGVGKTTLAKEVCRQVTKEKLFDDVVMVFDVNQLLDLDMMQKQIAESLGLDILEETLSRRAHRICNVIKEKKVLVIFDDVRASIDLKAVGIPNVATCKILWTSRSRIVLDFDYMCTQKEFQLQFLGEEETWRLFEKTVGDVTKDPTIRNIAVRVAKKCGGFPSLVVTVASSLKNRSNSHLWEHSLTQLEPFIRNRLTERAYLALEWSYEELDEEEELKPLFLLCGITAQKNYISLEDLLTYSLGLGWFKNVSIEKARNTLHSLVEQLKDYCLLLDGNENGLVRIHDLVRNFAVSIASRDQHILSRAYGNELEEWPNKDFCKKCFMISLPSSNLPRMPKVLEFPKLKLFRLWNIDESLEFSCDFSEEMKELRVLALTNLCIPSLPPSLQFLNIQTLCLCGCQLEDVALVGQLRNLEFLSFANSNVKHLPEKIRQLSRLRLLDLNNCTELEVISPNIISNLERLEELRMRNSFNQWEVEGSFGRRSNASLSELERLLKLKALDIHIRDAGILPADLFSNKLDRYQILIGDDWKWEDVDESFNRLLKLNLTSSNQLNRGLERLLKKSKSLYLDAFDGFHNVDYQCDEDFQELKHLDVQKNAEIRYIINDKVLPNLTSLIVHGCDRLKFLLSSSMARSLVQLKHLRVFECQIMEDIVLTKEYDEENTEEMLPKLEELELNHIPNLTRFCSGKYIELPSLDTVKVVECTKLETFISDSLSNNIRVYEEIEEGDFMENLETGLDHFLFDENVVCPNLTRLIVHRCDMLSFLLSSSIVRSLKQLQHLEISECAIMQEVVFRKEYGEENTDAMFPTLKELQLCYLPNLARFSSRSDIEFPSLERLKIVECTKLETVITTPI